jgi:hypothetical protein
MRDGFPNIRELQAAAIPAWVPKRSDTESDAQYYLWSAGESLTSRIFVRQASLSDLLQGTR